MKFPWDRYVEVQVEKRNTLQIFITNKCNLKCKECFARNIIDNDKNMEVEEYKIVVFDFIQKQGKQINIIGGEPFLHPQLLEFLKINQRYELKTTIYTNGYYLDKYKEQQLQGAKLRVSVYSYNEDYKPITNIKTNIPLDICYMVSKNTTVEDLLKSIKYIENNLNCNVFFISSLRELDNERKEFFDDTDITMPVIEYKELVHNLLDKYVGHMDIHVSKRGVFESSVNKCSIRCKFSNYFIGGKIIQCPYDIVNKKYQDDYEFDSRYCRHNNTCLMSKVVYRNVQL